MATKTTLRAPVALSATYFANFAALAASAPFLALLLRDAGLSDEMVAEYLAALLLVRWAAIGAWTWLADRWRSVARVLRVVSVGALVVFAPLAIARASLGLVVAVLAAFAALRAPFGPLLDSATLAEQRATGVRFGRLRAWGTAGYALGAIATGEAVAKSGAHGVVVATLATTALAAVLAFGVPSRAPIEAGDAAPAPSAWRALKNPRLAGLFAIALLHQVGLAPYDALFATYLAGFGAASAAGAAIALGAGAELVFFLAGASLPRRWGAAKLLRLACAGSALRWAITAWTHDARVLVAAQALHALTFGAFYLASIAIVDDEWPESRRAIGQGIFSAWAFGIAAAIGLALAGVVARAHGLDVVFAVGAIASLVATFVPLGRARSCGEASHLDRTF